MVSGTSGSIAGLNMPGGPTRGTRVPSKSKPRSRIARGRGASPKRRRRSPRKSNARKRTAASTSSRTEDIRVVAVKQHRIWVLLGQGILDRYAGGPLDQLQQAPLPVQLVAARHSSEDSFAPGVWLSTVVDTPGPLRVNVSIPAH